MRRKIGNNEGLSIEKPKHKNGTRQRVTAILATTALMVSGEFAVYKTFFDKKCEAPSASALGTVATLFDRPIKPPGVTVETREEFNERIEKKEQELGIAFPAYDAEKLADLEAKVTLPDKASFSDYLEMARGITDQLGMTITTYANSELKDKLDAKEPTAQELEGENAKRQLVYLMQNLTTIPTTLSKNMGLKYFILTAHGKLPGEKNEYGGAAKFDEQAILIDIDDPQDSTIPHEIDHFVDAATCGAGRVYKDPGYEKLNDKKGHADEDPVSSEFLSARPKTFEHIQSKYNLLHEMQRVAIRKNDEVAYCKNEKELRELGKDVEEMDDYSYKTVAESKANIGKQLFDPKKYDVALDPDMPRKRNKFLFLIARLYEKYPTVVEYYSLFGTRPDSTYKCD
jgi:hypothetical protein